MSNSLRDIRLFVAAYEERSFTAAARREHATQSGVSQHIRKLEDTLDAKLFARDKGRVVPTPAGDGYYRHCIELLNTYAKATSAVRKQGAGLAGNIVIGLMPTTTRCVLAPALARFIDQHPNVIVRVVEGYSAALTEQVQAAELEFAVVPAFAGAPGLKSRLFLQHAGSSGFQRQIHPDPPRARTARRLGPLKTGGAEQGQYAAAIDRDLSCLQRRCDRSPARTGCHAGHP